MITNLSTNILKDYHIPYIIINMLIMQNKRNFERFYSAKRVGVNKECGFGEVGAI
ncbi:hypothetical protein UT300007_06230 [Clostridium sp. CTA-7]|jgi:hypothetical protein